MDIHPGRYPGLLSEIDPDAEDAAGPASFKELYKKGFPIEKAAIDVMKSLKKGEKKQCWKN